MLRLSFGEKVYAIVLFVACMWGLGFFLAAPRGEVKASAFNPTHCNFEEPTFTETPIPTGISITATVPCVSAGGILDCKARFTKQHYVWSAGEGKWLPYGATMEGWETTAHCGNNASFTTLMTYDQYPHGFYFMLVVGVLNYDWSTGQYYEVGSNGTILWCP